MKNIFSFSVYFWNTETVYPSTSEIGNSKLYSNRRNITSPRTRIRCITLSRFTFIFSFSSFLSCERNERSQFGVAFAFHGSSRVSRIYFLHLAYIRYAAISERQNLRCRCTGRADGDADDGIVARVGGRPPFCSLCHVGRSLARVHACASERVAMVPVRTPGTA